MKKKMQVEESIGEQSALDVVEDKTDALAPLTGAGEVIASAEVPSEGEAPPADATPPPDGRRTIEYWAETLATPKWLFAGMKVGKDWPIGKEVTREDYEAAVRWAAGTPREGEEAIVCR